jgi:hypothetical protein
MAVLLLACAVDADAAASGARNPRDQRNPVSFQNAEPVTDPDLIGEWLLRLAGRYRAEGSSYMPSRTFEFRNSQGRMTEGEFQAVFEPARGVVDCSNIGSGPGIQCILDIGWVPQYEIILDPDAGPVGVWNLPGGEPYLDPAMMLVGLDLRTQRLAYLLVDNKGLPEGGSGSVAGDRGTLSAPCVNAPPLFNGMNPAAEFDGRRPQQCTRIIRIDARPGADVVNVSINIEINEQLVTVTELVLRRVARNDPSPLDSRRRR